MEKPPVNLSLSIMEILNCHPELVPVFMKFQTACVGCTMASFCDLEFAIRIHQLEEIGFLKEIEIALNQTEE
jgi:hybrid cluster-associated redox disulfide protein